ncbi:MAG: PAS domain-containing sensor histidine kinase [Myxococcota bacterium]
MPGRVASYGPVPEAAKILSLTTDLIYVYDLKTGANRYANHNLGTQLGFTRGDLEAMGQDWLLQVVHPEDIDDVIGHHAALESLADNAHRELVYRVRSKGGSYRWLSSRDTPCERDEQGRVSAILGTCRDVTLLMSVTEGLRQANRELNSFSAIASHDLKAPLRTAAIFADLVRELLPKEAAYDVARSHLAVIREQCKHGRELLEALGRVAQVSGRDLEVAPVAAGDLVAEAVALTQAECDAAGVVIVTDMGPSSAPVVTVDRPLIVASLQNLIGNAIRYAVADDPRIRIEAKRHDEHWVDLTVRDFGPGIPRSKHETVFEPYRRLAERPEEGQGIGLSVVRRIVMRHGGQVTLDSLPGEGAAFTLRLPALPPHPRASNG